MILIIFVAIAFMFFLLLIAKKSGNGVQLINIEKITIYSFFPLFLLINKEKPDLFNWKKIDYKVLN
jgi:hypothetical protein